MPETGQQTDPRKRASTVRIAIGVVALTAVAIVVAWMNTTPPRSAGASLIGGPFALQEGDGRTVSDETLRGKPFLVYFGYTHCPDVCPTELARIAEVFGKMGDKAIPALFITVDPERDTPKVMQDYASSFGPAIVGLSGSPQAVGATMKAFRVFSRKGPIQSDGAYSMDHSSVVYLMNKNGAFVEALNLDRPAEETAKELEGYR